MVVMKKSALLCSALLCSPVVYGSNVSRQVEKCKVGDLKGITVGIDLGYSHSSLKNEQYARGLSLGGGLSYPENTSEVVKQRRCCTNVSLNIGYTCFYDSWYFGAAGEIFFGANGKKSVVLDKVFPTKSKISGFSAAVKLKGGYYFEDLNTAIYGIAGLNWRNVEMQYNYDDKTISAIGSKAKLSTPLYTVGIGIERPIFKKLSISAEYEYTWRNSKDTSTVGINGVSARFYIKQRMNEHNFKIGIRYHI